MPYLHYVRQDHAVEDAREIALTFALWAGPQLAELMRHDVVRINAYLDKFALAVKIAGYQPE